MWASCGLSVVSCAHYFRIPTESSVIRLLHIISSRRITRKYFKIYNIFYKSLYLRLYDEEKRINKMIRIVDKGEKLMVWNKTPWDKHLDDYLNSNVLVVKYEDMRNDPVTYVRLTLKNFDIESSDEKIKSVINNQSFEVKRIKFINENDKRRHGHMREGNLSSWQNILNHEQINFLNTQFEKQLKHFNYIT